MEFGTGVLVGFVAIVGSAFIVVFFLFALDIFVKFYALYLIRKNWDQRQVKYNREYGMATFVVPSYHRRHYLCWYSYQDNEANSIIQHVYDSRSNLHSPYLEDDFWGALKGTIFVYRFNHVHFNKWMVKQIEELSDEAFVLAKLGG